jgi:hypothetical protein
LDTVKGIELEHPTIVSFFAGNEILNSVSGLNFKVFTPEVPGLVKRGMDMEL